MNGLGIAPGSLDVVLVDGRARVACALTALPLLSAQGVVVIHDFTWRPYYNAVLEAFERVQTVGTLVVLRPRPAARAAPPKRDAIKVMSPTVFS